MQMNPSPLTEPSKTEASETEKLLQCLLNLTRHLPENKKSVFNESDMQPRLESLISIIGGE